MFGGDHAFESAFIYDSTMLDVSTALSCVEHLFPHNYWKYQSGLSYIPLIVLLFYYARSFVVFINYFIRVLYFALIYMGRQPDTSQNVRKNAGKYSLSRQGPLQEESSALHRKPVVLVRYSHYRENPHLLDKTAAGKHRSTRETIISNARSPDYPQFQETTRRVERTFNTSFQRYSRLLDTTPGEASNTRSRHHPHILDATPNETSSIHSQVYCHYPGTTLDLCSYNAGKRRSPRDPSGLERSSNHSLCRSQPELGCGRESKLEKHSVSPQNTNVVVRDGGNFSVAFSNTPRCRAPLQIGYQQSELTTHAEARSGRTRRTNPTKEIEYVERNADPKSISAPLYPSLSRQKIYLPPAHSEELCQHPESTREGQFSLSQSAADCDTPEEELDLNMNPAQYYRYSHLLVFPVQSMFSRKETDSGTLIESSTSCMNCKESIEPRMSYSNNNSEPNITISRNQHRLAPYGVSKSVEVLISGASESESSSENRNLSAASNCQATIGRARREKSKRPSEFNPYDPYRPARMRSPQKQPEKTRVRSISNLEWKFLRAFEAKAFKPQMRAWRSGIDISSDSNYFTNNESVRDYAAADKTFSAEICFIHDENTSTLTVHLLQMLCPVCATTTKTRLQVQVTLLPRRMKFKSRGRAAHQKHWHESFVFHQIRKGDLKHLAVIFSVCTQTLVGKAQTLAQGIVRLQNVGLSNHLPMWIHLKPDLAEEESVERPCRGRLADSNDASVVREWESGVRLQVGLRYSQSSGRLTVEIITAANLW